ncbi:MAG: Type IV secretory pathway VirB4 component-like protein [candidate division WS6 bacterium GW2011_GWC1_36_11]|uniref:Type IV secretory pathway VirB4 component-like protein n=1 Tax=candidate division WS6 bacterium GW2011_GWC1_36_11 TaxID=1619090 RepID=A0A0G0DCI5_9BACT|nr:MAG: Type IV secretory pathway VirB4 component-like protein [candidate division WS6 bacterium GW2011_GWC1_36_11]
MSDEINNYNRTFETKTTQELGAQAEKLQSVGEKYANFKQDLQKEIAKKDEAEKKDRFNDPVEETEIKKPKKKNPILKVLDSISAKISGKPVEPEVVANTQPEDDDITMLDKDMSIKDIVAPIDIEVDFNHLQMGDYYFKTFFISGYPRIVGPNWLSPIVNFEHSLRISTFYYPVESKTILEKLKRKIGEMEATLYSQMEDRKVVDPTLKVALSDAQQLQDSIAEGSEKYFHYGMYITIYAPNKALLEKYSRNVTSTFAAMNVTAKPATLQQDQGFISTQPLGLDKLYITRNMDTTSLATTFPFVTSELTMDKGIMYGINMHNKSLVIFDRFQLENANTVVFAKSGAGKSYFVKLEAVRSLMLGVEIIIIDPEKEYEELSKAVGGSYISFSQDKGNKMNPFELSGVTEEGDDELRMKLLTLHGFFKIIFGGLTNVEESILDKALILTYREKGITFDPTTQTKKPPLLEDMYKVLKGMAENEAHDLARRMEKYIIGSAAGIFNEESNFEIQNPFTVFSIRDLQEELKPLAMYLMLDFIWTKIRKDKKKRLLIVDEAWYMMQSPDSANFMYSIAKRARKYYLGLSTITQDVADFLTNDMGKAIISNSSMQILMKQSPSSVDKLQTVFNLSDGEKNFLLSCDRGQGLFFAGANHVGIQVISSQAEHELITSDPRDLEKKKANAGMTDTRTLMDMAQIFESPADQQVMNNVSAMNRQQQVIQQAIGKRKYNFWSGGTIKRRYTKRKNTYYSTRTSFKLY